MLLPQQPDPAAAWQAPTPPPPVPTSTIMADVYNLITQADQQRSQQEAAQADAESQALAANRAQIDKSQTEQSKMNPAEQQEESGKYWRSTMTGAKPTFAQNMTQQRMDSASQQALIEEQRQQNEEPEPAKKAAPTPAPDDTATKAKATPAPSTVGNDYAVDQPVSGSEESIPFYEEGVASVPQTGPAIVHKGEKITPANENPDNPDNRDNPDPDRETHPVVVHFAHPTDSNHQGANVAFPASMSMDAIEAAAKNLWTQTKQGAGALAESFGLPSSASEVKPYLQRSVQAAQHPIEAIQAAGTATAQMLGHPSDPALLDKAKQAWDAGDKVTASRHAISYLLPFIGNGADRAGDEMQNGEYGKAVGHTVAAVLPMLFGAEETPVTSEAEAAANAARVSQPVNRIPTFPEKPALENTPLNGRRGPLPNLRPIEYIENAPVVPKSEAEIAAANFIRKQRLDFNPAGRVLETNGLSDEKTGVANIGGRTAVTHATETPATATDADVLAYIRKSFPKADADRLAAKLELVDQEAAAPRLSPEDEAALAHATLARFAANSKDVDAVSQLAQIKQRLGLKDPKELSAEAQATAGAPKSAADVNAFADSAKKRLAVPPKAQVQSVDYGEDTFGAGAREHRLMSGDKKMGSVVTAPLSQTEMEIKSAHIQKPFRSQGHSLPLYEQGFADAKAQGYDTVRSDRVDVSPEAMRTWESLLARNPDAVQKFNDPASGRVAYRVNLDKYKAGASKKVPSVPVPSKASATPASGPSFLERANEAASKALNKHTEYDLTGDWRDAITGDSTK